MSTVLTLSFCEVVCRGCFEAEHVRFSSTVAF